MKLKRSKKLRLPALYRAAVDYIEKHGGRVAVIGGVSLLHLVVDRKYKHHLVIHFTGRAPKFNEESKP